MIDRFFKTVTMTVMAATAALALDAAAAAIQNLAELATGFGLLPDVTLDQGGVAGIADGRMYTWIGNSNPPTSPRSYASGLTNLQPYMTWDSAQTVQYLRIWQDAASSWNRIRVDTLIGSDPAVDGNWVLKYDSGTGLSGAAARFQDVDLGIAYSTRGVRIRADISGSTDVDVGEVAVFGPGYQLGRLTDLRVTPDSVAASSWEHGTVAHANDGNWYTRWLGAAPGVNPGTDYTYDMFFSDVALDAVSLTFAIQVSYCTIPTSWELLADTGSGLDSLGIFSPVLAQNDQLRGQYYLNVGSLTGVDQLRLRVAEADIPNDLRLGVVEFEAFSTIPEPTSLIVLLAGTAIAAYRRRKRSLPSPACP